MKESIIKLFNEGKTYNEIVSILNCAKSTVSYHLKYLRNFKQPERIKSKCRFCDKELLLKPSVVRENNFCSQSHRTKFYNTPENCSKWGLKSVESQSKRSKNEILFYEMCKKEFTNVTSNERYFNGWDADIILHDLKIAVLWNGKWHYEKLTEKHSLEQVKRRDFIKIKEIEEKGYLPYIIKDMGKYNEKFVKKSFDSFKNICG